MTKNIIKSVGIILLSLYTLSCSKGKRVINYSNSENCLTLDPLNYNNAKFNPKWMSNNGVKKVIKREYLDGKNGNIHLVTVLYFNAEGYIKTKFSGLGYPKDDSPNEEKIFSRWDYTYEFQDSFVIQSYRIVRFHNEKGEMNNPDTLSTSISIHNINLAKRFVDEKNEIIRLYEYNKDGRLIEVKGRDRKSMYNLKYLTDNRIQVEKYSHWKKEYFNSWATFNKKGQLIHNYDESNRATHEFMYNRLGEMTEEKTQFNNKEPNYHTFEYIK